MLSARRFTKSYRGTYVFRDLSLNVNHGEVVFIVGNSGCGKSTFLRLLADLEPCDSGELMLDGVPREMFLATVWRTKVAYVPQARVRGTGTPLDAFARAQTFKARRGGETRDFAAIARSVGLDDELLHRPWAVLSGGQNQRAIIALTIALKPQVLLLDEPTSACDPAATVLVEKAVVASGSTVVWVSHDPEQPRRVGGRVVSFDMV